MFGTFDAIPKRKHITFFKLGKLWVFKQFFDNRVLFDALLKYYNKDLFRFEFKYTGARNNALKLLERNGFDYDLVENLKGYVVETVFFVKDDGLGIDPIMQKNIFRLFYQGSGAENSNAGLALSRRIIEVHGGRMWIESVVNKGCAVYFTLPSN